MRLRAYCDSLKGMEKEKNIKEKDDTVAVYEASYLLLPSLAVEQVPHEIASIKEAIISRGGAVIVDESPVLIDLAYSMTKVVQTSRYKCDTAYFGWVKFEMPKDLSAQTGGIEAVKKSLDANVDVLRYIIIKTVRENTLLNGKMKLQKEDKSRREDEVIPEEVLDASPDKEVASKEISKEIDKSIDDLVVA